ncbi:hypothetical protein QL285_003567 [Trifolium repens]|nr:hypothetical protein QL285_003567 [Trifolium repens]
MRAVAISKVGHKMQNFAEGLEHKINTFSWPIKGRQVLRSKDQDGTDSWSRAWIVRSEDYIFLPCFNYLVYSEILVSFRYLNLKNSNPQSLLFWVMHASVFPSWVAGLIGTNQRRKVGVEAPSNRADSVKNRGARLAS